MSFRADKDTFIFCTMPRSGSYYCLRFLLNLDQALLGRSETVSFDKQKFGHHFLEGVDANIVLGHLSSPFLTEKKIKEILPRQYSYWSSLKKWPTFPIDARDELSPLIDKYYPGRISIIFVYRNPLDQAVSLNDHLKNHKNYSAMYRFDANSIEVSIEWYFKMFFWHFVAAQYIPGATQFMCYENLIQRPEQAWSWIAGRLLGKERLELSMRHVHQAIEMSSYEKSILWQENNRKSLADDQAGESPTHLRGGEVGKWKSRLAGLEINPLHSCKKHMENLKIPERSFIFE